MPDGVLIAVVDDDRSIRNATQDLLNAAGFTTFTFENAKSFLASSVRKEVACLIADMRMPGMTGLELSEHLAASNTSIPTIIISAHPEELTRVRARTADFRCFLTKPFSPDELLECVRKALTSSRDPRAIPRS
jgi:FixJ family two-component response regulator